MLCKLAPYLQIQNTCIAFGESFNNKAALQHDLHSVNINVIVDGAPGIKESLISGMNKSISILFYFANSDTHRQEILLLNGYPYKYSLHSLKLLKISET